VSPNIPDPASVPLHDQPTPPEHDPPNDPLHDPAGDPTYEPPQPVTEPTPNPAGDPPPEMLPGGAYAPHLGMSMFSTYGDKRSDVIAYIPKSAHVAAAHNLCCPQADNHRAPGIRTQLPALAGPDAVAVRGFSDDRRLLCGRQATKRSGRTAATLRQPRWGLGFNPPLRLLSTPA
jgi:hypothetical protein